MENNAIFIVTGVLLGSIIILFVLSYINEKRKTKKFKKQRELFEKQQNVAYKEIIAKINAVINELEKQLQNFVVSIGEHKMGEINEWAKITLKNITKEAKYKEFFLNVEHDNFPFVNQYIEKFIQNKANSWKKSCEIELEYFKTTGDSFKEDDQYQEYYKKSLDTYILPSKNNRISNNILNIQDPQVNLDNNIDNNDKVEESE